MNIREYQEKDRKLICRIYDSCKLDELVNEINEFELLPLLSDGKRSKQIFDSEIFVCESNKPLGFCALYGTEIRALFVLSSCRGKGAGGKMLEFMLSKTNGESSLYVAKSNLMAKELYKKYGFLEMDDFETTYNSKPVFANKMVRSVAG